MHSNRSAKTTTIQTDRSVWVYYGLSLLCGRLWQVSHSSFSWRTEHFHPTPPSPPPIMAKPFQFLPPCLFDGNPTGTGKHGNISQAWELVFYSIKLVSQTALEWYRLTWWPRCPEANTKLWTNSSSSWTSNTLNFHINVCVNTIHGLFWPLIIYQPTKKKQTKKTLVFLFPLTSDKKI